MPYIGKELVSGSFVSLDSISADGSTAYSLTKGGTAYDPGQAERLIVSVDGVTQAPNSAFTVSGNTITFSEAVPASSSIDYIVAMGDVMDVGTVSNGTITSDKLSSNFYKEGIIINSATIDNNVTIASTERAMIAGSITISANKNLTVNGELTIV